MLELARKTAGCGVWVSGLCQVAQKNNAKSGGAEFDAYGAKNSEVFKLAFFGAKNTSVYYYEV